MINDVENPEELVPVIKAARKTNESMPEYTVKLAEQELKKRGGQLSGTNVVILGLAYRPYIKETLYSPTLDMVKILRAKGANVSVFDPIFKKEETEEITGAKSGDFESLLKEADCIIISTMYEMFNNLRDKVRSNCIIVDGRNKLRNVNKGIGK